MGDLLQHQGQPLGGVELVFADERGVLRQQQVDVGQLLAEAVVGGVEGVDEGAQAVGVEAGVLELGEGGVELGGQAGAVGGRAVVGQPVAVAAEQQADDHASAGGGDLGHADVAATVQDRLAELAEVDHADAGERAELDRQQPLGLERGLLGDQPVDGGAEGVGPAERGEAVDDVGRLAGAGAAEDELHCAHGVSAGERNPNGRG